MDYLAMTLALSGIWLIGLKITVGWFFAALGSFVWIIVAYENKIKGLLYFNIAMVCLNLFNFIKWLGA